MQEKLDDLLNNFRYSSNAKELPFHFSRLDKAFHAVTEEGAQPSQANWVTFAFSLFKVSDYILLNDFPDKAKGIRKGLRDYALYAFMQSNQLQHVYLLLKSDLREQPHELPAYVTRLNTLLENKPYELEAEILAELKNGETMLTHCLGVQALLHITTHASYPWRMQQEAHSSLVKVYLQEFSKDQNINTLDTALNSALKANKLDVVTLQNFITAFDKLTEPGDKHAIAVKLLPLLDRATVLCPQFSCDQSARERLIATALQLPFDGLPQRWVLFQQGCVANSTSPYLLEFIERFFEQLNNPATLKLDKIKLAAELDAHSNLWADIIQNGGESALTTWVNQVNSSESAYRIQALAKAYGTLVVKEMNRHGEQAQFHHQFTQAYLSKAWRLRMRAALLGNLEAKSKIARLRKLFESSDNPNNLPIFPVHDISKANFFAVYDAAKKRINSVMDFRHQIERRLTGRGFYRIYNFPGIQKQMHARLAHADAQLLNICDDVQSVTDSNITEKLRDIKRKQQQLDEKTGGWRALGYIVQILAGVIALPLQFRRWFHRISAGLILAPENRDRFINQYWQERYSCMAEYLSGSYPDAFGQMIEADKHLGVLPSDSKRTAAVQEFVDSITQTNTAGHFWMYDKTIASPKAGRIEATFLINKKAERARAGKVPYLIVFLERGVMIPEGIRRMLQSVDSIGAHVVLMNDRSMANHGGMFWSIDDLKQDGITLYNHLKDEMNISEEDLIIYGHCNGGVKATLVAEGIAQQNNGKAPKTLIDRSFSSYYVLIREAVIENLLAKGRPKFWANIWGYATAMVTVSLLRIGDWDVRPGRFFESIPEERRRHFNIILDAEQRNAVTEQTAAYRSTVPLPDTTVVAAASDHWHVKGKIKQQRTVVKTLQAEVTKTEASPAGLRLCLEESAEIHAFVELQALAERRQQAFLCKRDLNGLKAYIRAPKIHSVDNQDFHPHTAPLVHFVDRENVPVVDHVRNFIDSRDEVVIPKQTKNRAKDETGRLLDPLNSLLTSYENDRGLDRNSVAEHIRDYRSTAQQLRV